MINPNSNSVRAHRKRLGWSVYELAKRADLHPNTVSLAERGCCSARTRDRLARALSVKPWDLERRPCDPPEGAAP